MRRRRPAAQKRSTILRLGYLGRRPRPATGPPRRPPLKNGAIHVVTLLLALLTFSLLVHFIGQVILSARLESQLVAKAAEVEQLEAENERLQASVNHAESDSYVMQIAREQLFMAFPDDVVVLLQHVDAPAEAPAEAAEPQPVPLPQQANWEQWWQAVFPPLDPEVSAALQVLDEAGPDPPPASPPANP